MSAATYMGGAIISAGQEDIAAEFHVSRFTSTLVLSTYLIGNGFGAMIWAALSEVPAVGRAPVLAFSIFGFVLLQIPTALSVNFGMLLVFRLVGGFFGAAIVGVAGGCVSDMYKLESRAYAMSLWNASVVCGPCE